MSPKIRFDPVLAANAYDDLEEAMRKVRVHLLSLKTHEADRAIIKLEGAVLGVEFLLADARKKHGAP